MSATFKYSILAWFFKRDIKGEIVKDLKYLNVKDLQVKQII